MPDKAGRVINVGGWSEISTFGVRLYTPSGTLGVNGTTDWEENADELSLQVASFVPLLIPMTQRPIGRSMVSHRCSTRQRLYPRDWR
jgi:hypothetical protein